MRQRTAFPPNYIHSLDSSHMMMTALACKRAGLNFAGSLHFFPFSFPTGSFILAKNSIWLVPMFNPDHISSYNVPLQESMIHIGPMHVMLTK